MGRAQLVVQCLLFGVIYYLLERFGWRDHSVDGWPAALLTIFGYGIGFGIALRFFAAWRRRQELRAQEENQ